MRDELSNIADLTERRPRASACNELEIAQHIESMLPKNHYVGAGATRSADALLRPARVVGGDLYSYVVRGDGRAS
jgi:serine phosphatase RsbU (regulator of sigma subunit)